MYYPPELKGRTGCGRCYECKHHAMEGKKYVCLNLNSYARKTLEKGIRETETLLPDIFAFSFHDCCEVDSSEKE